MRSVTLILFASFVFTNAFAQYREIKKLADKDFDEKKYFEAAYNYNLLTDSSKTKNVALPTYLSRSDSKQKTADERTYIWYRLAESYRLYQNYTAAEGWYAKIINGSSEQDYPLVRLWYGVCLRANEHFDESIKQLQQFKAGFNGDAQIKTQAERELASSLFAKQQYVAPRSVNAVKLADAWNNEGGNYALIKNNGSTWLTSTKYNATAKRYLNNIYRVENGSTALIPNGGNNTDYGMPSLTKDGKRMYLTAWHKEEDKNVLAIYVYNTGGGNASLKLLNKNINAQGYNAMQPRVTDDGKRLYYASNKPGSRGGFDIWMSDLDANGDAINTTNLGPQINTTDDEEAPFYDAAKNRLVYSSKGFTGMGGFDLFESYYGNNQWSAPKNLGYPANSTKDDLYYFVDPDNTHHAYLSSDRRSDCCLAIYELNEEPLNIRVNLTACNTGRLLHDATVTLLDADTKRPIRTIEQSVNGSYNIKTYDRFNYILRVEKDGYLTKNISLNDKTGTDTLYSPQICLEEYTLNKPIAIKNILYNYSEATLRPESRTALDTIVTILKENPTLKIELGAHTDSVGTDAANLKLSQLRADACVAYIISKGVDRKRIYAKGYGESRPVAPNSQPNGADNPEGRQLNRRTEFTILSK